MKPNEYPKEIYNALYSDEFGDIVGLEEVMYIDPIPKRVVILEEILKKNDNYIAYQSASILAAWGNSHGTDFLIQMIKNDVYEKTQLVSSHFNPFEGVYDAIGKTIRLYELSEGKIEKILECHKLLLKKYPKIYFRGSFCDSLTNSKLTSSIQNELIEAHNLTYALGNYFQASLLLPSIMKNFSELGENIIRTYYLKKWDINSSEMEFIAEALAFSKTQEFIPILNELLSSTNQLKRDKAQKSIDILNSN